MTRLDDSPKKKRGQYVFNLTLAAVASQVGCLTLLVIFAALFAGLWLDNRFDTAKPIFTIALLIGSVPVTLVMMFWVVKTSTSRISQDAEKKIEGPKEERERGTSDRDG
jgi:hypothetical protein